MNPTPFEISVALVMAGMSVIMVVWFQRYLAEASTKRTMRMMARVGLDPEIAGTNKYIKPTHSDPRTEAIMKDVSYRCRKCMAEDFCDRWIAGEAEGDNSFCPNARTFGLLARTVGRTG